MVLSQELGFIAKSTNTDKLKKIRQAISCFLAASLSYLT